MQTPSILVVMRIKSENIFRGRKTPFVTDTYCVYVCAQSATAYRTDIQKKEMGFFLSFLSKEGKRITHIPSQKSEKINLTFTSLVKTS